MSKAGKEMSETEKLVLQTMLEERERELTKRFDAEKDNLLIENRKLNDEVAEMKRHLVANDAYIQYLLNSVWWRITSPLRTIARRVKKHQKMDYVFVEKIVPDMELETIKGRVYVVIYTYNAGEEFTVQLGNLKKQRGIEDLKVVVVDGGSTDNTVKYARKFGAEVITNDEFECRKQAEHFAGIDGGFVVMMSQNEIVEGKHWIYQAIRPIKDRKAIATLFVDGDLSELKRGPYYVEMEQRVARIVDKDVLFLPCDRDTVSFLSPSFLSNTRILVRKARCDSIEKGVQ